MASALERLNDDVLRLIVKAVADLPNDRLTDIPFLVHPMTKLTFVSKRLRQMCLPHFFAKVQVSHADSELAQRDLDDIRKVKGALDCIRAFRMCFDPAHHLRDTSTQHIRATWLETCALLPALRELHIRGDSGMGPDLGSSLHHIGVRMYGVQTLHIGPGCTFSGLAEAFPEVKNVSMHFSESDTTNLRAWSQHGKIQHVELTTCDGDWAPKKHPWYKAALTAISEVLPQISGLTLNGLVDQSNLDGFSNCLTGFHALRHITIPGKQATPEDEDDDDDDSDCSFASEEEEWYEYKYEDESARRAFFNACSTLETLCIPRKDFRLNRSERMMVRKSQDKVTRPSKLPHGLLMRGAQKDRNGHFVTGIPNAFRENWDDDDGDNKYSTRKWQEETDKEIRYEEWASHQETRDWDYADEYEYGYGSEGDREDNGEDAEYSGGEGGCEDEGDLWGEE